MAPRALLEAVAHNATEHHDSCDAPALSYLDNWFGDHEAHDEEGGGAALILVGVLMCAVGSICQNFGNNVMSLGHRKKAEHLVREGQHHHHEHNIILHIHDDPPLLLSSVATAAAAENAF